MELLCFIVHLLSSSMSVRNCSLKRSKSSEFARKNILRSIQSCPSWRVEEVVRVLRVPLQFRVAGGAPKMKSRILLDSYYSITRGWPSRPTLKVGVTWGQLSRLALRLGVTRGQP